MGLQHNVGVVDSFLLLSVKNFVSGQAIYLDYMVPTPIFQNVIPVIALSNPMLLNAIAACGAYNLGRKVGKMEPIQAAAEYYKEANSMLYLALKSKEKDFEVCLATALIITVYEMGFEVSHDLTSHMFGVKTLLEEFPCYFDTVEREITFSSPITKGAFWVLLHCDVLVAFLLRSIPLWNPNNWGPVVGIGDTSYYDTRYPAPGKQKGFSGFDDKSADQHSNNRATESGNANIKSIGPQKTHFWYRKVLHFLFRICSLRGLGYDPSPPNQFPTWISYPTAIQRLLQELQEFLSSMPFHMKPLFDLNMNDKDRAKEASQIVTDRRCSSHTGSSTANGDSYNSMQETAWNQHQHHHSHHLQQPLFGVVGIGQQSHFSSKADIPDFAERSSDERVEMAFTGTHPTTLSQIFFTDPVYSIIYAYCLLAILALMSLKPSGLTMNHFGGQLSTGLNMQGDPKYGPFTTMSKQQTTTSTTKETQKQTKPVMTQLSSILNSVPSSSSADSSSGYDSFKETPFSSTYVLPGSKSSHATIEFEECRQYARQLVSIVISSSKDGQAGGMTAWGLIFAQQFISDPQVREYILAYVGKLCAIGWSADMIKMFLTNGWAMT